MCDALIVGLKDIGNGVWDLIETPYSAVVDTYDYLGREVSQLASIYLSPRIGAITRKIFNALPVTLALLLLPKSVTVLTVSCLLVIGMIAPAMDDLIGKETRKSIYRGISDSEFIHTAAAIVQLAVTGNMGFLNAAIGGMVCSVLGYLYSETN